MNTKQFLIMIQINYQKMKITHEKQTQTTIKKTKMKRKQLKEQN